MTISAQFWHNKRVLVTGHTGFKGSWLCLWLQQLGAEVTGFALTPPTNPNLFESARVAAGMRSIIGDIRDYAAIASAVETCAPDIVIHMAAQPLVRYSYQHPVETYSTNVMGVVHLLEALRVSTHASATRAVINVTTDKCYENTGSQIGFREDAALGGYDPYSNSKACSELVSSAYRQSYFSDSTLALATARAGNVIGGGDWAQDRLIPDMLTAFEKNSPVTVRNQFATRPWQHVLEPISGYLMLAERLYNEGQAFAQAWNFGPDSNDVQPVQWLVERLVAEWGAGASWILDAQSGHPHEASLLQLDISKAAQQLQWHPRWDLTTALQKIIQWHKPWLAGADARNLCLNQITEFNSGI